MDIKRKLCIKGDHHHHHPPILKMGKEEDDHINMCPADFRCPISMELMKDPVTISTGVTYERHNIEKWFFTYKKNTCPATMQCVDSFDITPNSTLKRLILSWLDNLKNNTSRPPPQLQPPVKHEEMAVLLSAVESSPFKVSPLRKLRSIVEEGTGTAGASGGHHQGGNFIKEDLIRSGGVEVLVKILVNVEESSESEYVTFRACEVALAVLYQLPLLSQEERAFKLLSEPESMKSIAILLQRGSADARLHAISIFRNMADKTDYDWSLLIRDNGIDLFKSMLELVSDEICNKASSSALELLIQILTSSKKSRSRAIEAGGVCVLVELLPDTNRSKSEKILLLIKLLCECAEGRLAFVEHGIGIAAVSKKLLNVSNTATKLCVKILWLICNSHPTERVLEELLIYGSVKKLLALMHIGGRSSTKAKVISIFKSHGKSWKRYPCFPNELRVHLGLVDDSN